MSSRTLPSASTVPRASTMTRSTTPSSVSRSCVLSNTVMPRSSTSERTRRSKPRAVIGSSPEVGSSRNRISGSSAIARATAARLRMPPDNSLGTLPPASAGKPACSSRSATSDSIVAGASRVCSRSGTATFCPTVNDENSAPSWNIMPKRCRTASSSCGAALHMSVPSRRTRPALGRCRPIISRSSTDLPLPLAPISPTRVPRSTAKPTPSCTVCAPNRVTTASTSITAAMAGLTDPAFPAARRTPRRAGSPRRCFAPRSTWSPRPPPAYRGRPSCPCALRSRR